MWDMARHSHLQIYWVPLSHVIIVTPVSTLLANKVYIIYHFHLPLEVLERLVLKPGFEA